MTSTTSKKEDEENEKYELHYNIIDLHLSLYHNKDLDPLDNLNLLAKFIDVGDALSLAENEGIIAFPLLTFTMDNLKKDTGFTLKGEMKKILNTGKVMLANSKDNFDESSETLDLFKRFLSLYSTDPNQLNDRRDYLAKGLEEWTSGHDENRKSIYQKRITDTIDDSSSIIKDIIHNFSFKPIDIIKASSTPTPSTPQLPSSDLPPLPTPTPRPIVTTPTPTPKPIITPPKTTTAVTPSSDEIKKLKAAFIKQERESVNKEKLKCAAEKRGIEAQAKSYIASSVTLDTVMEILDNKNGISEHELMKNIKKTLNAALNKTRYTISSSVTPTTTIDLNESFKYLRTRISDGICTRRPFIEA